MIRFLREKGFFHLLSVNYLGLALSFGTVLVAAKFLDAREIGEIKILQSYTLVFAIFAGFGMNSAVLKACSVKRPERELEPILHLALRRVGWASLASLIVLWTLGWTGVLGSSPDLFRWLLVYSLAIPFMAATETLISFLQSRKRIQEMARAQFLVRVQSFTLIVVAAYLAGFHGYVVAAPIAYAAALLPLLRRTGLGFLSRPPARPSADFEHTALFSVLGNGVSALGAYADIFILDRFCAQRDEIGFYSMATYFFLGAMQITVTAQSIATPYLTERSGDEAWFKRQILLRQGQMILLSLGVVAVAWIGGNYLLTGCYGGKYGPAAAFLPWVLLRYVLSSSYSVLGVALFSRGLVRYNFMIFGLTTCVGVYLSYRLLQGWGVPGVAWAQVATGALNLILLAAFTAAALKTKTSPDGKAS